jgi:hypothetical protein
MEEKKIKSVITPDGEMEILDGFTYQGEDRKISVGILEDETIIINVRRFEESEQEPYTKEITNQIMRLSKKSIALLLVCIFKADKDFNLKLDLIIEELNKKQL